ncbi:MAG: HEAT repeat domain-containing protein [Holosporaceae bacterium]|jgi:hypothetical protein
MKEEFSIKIKYLNPSVGKKVVIEIGASNVSLEDFLKNPSQYTGFNYTGFNNWTWNNWIRELKSNVETYPIATDTLVQFAAAHEDISKDIRERALEAIKPYADRVIPELLEIAGNHEDKNASVRILAIQAIAPFADRALPELLKIAQNPENHMIHEEVIAAIAPHATADGMRTGLIKIANNSQINGYFLVPSRRAAITAITSHPELILESYFDLYQIVTKFDENNETNADYNNDNNNDNRLLALKAILSMPEIVQKHLPDIIKIAKNSMEYIDFRLIALQAITPHAKEILSDLVEIINTDKENGEIYDDLNRVAIEAIAPYANDPIVFQTLAEIAMDYRYDADCHRWPAIFAITSQAACSPETFKTARTLIEEHKYPCTSIIFTEAWPVEAKPDAVNYRLLAEKLMKDSLYSESIQAFLLVINSVLPNKVPAQEKVPSSDNLPTSEQLAVFREFQSSYCPQKFLTLLSQIEAKLTARGL